LLAALGLSLWRDPVRPWSHQREYNSWNQMHTRQSLKMRVQYSNHKSDQKGESMSHQSSVGPASNRTEPLATERTIMGGGDRRSRRAAEREGS
jgi:hypothetical protein